LQFFYDDDSKNVNNNSNDNHDDYKFLFDSFVYFFISFMKFRYYIINHYHPDPPTDHDHDDDYDDDHDHDHHHHSGIVKKKIQVETAEESLRIDNYLKLNGNRSNVKEVSVN